MASVRCYTPDLATPISVHRVFLFLLALAIQTRILGNTFRRIVILRSVTYLKYVLQSSGIVPQKDKELNGQETA